jgi:hypothetical protein
MRYISPVQRPMPFGGHSLDDLLVVELIHAILV